MAKQATDIKGVAHKVLDLIDISNQGMTKAAAELKIHRDSQKEAAAQINPTVTALKEAGFVDGEDATKLAEAARALKTHSGTLATLTKLAKYSAKMHAELKKSKTAGDIEPGKAATDPSALPNGSRNGEVTSGGKQASAAPFDDPNRYRGRRI